ncbi:MAG TPA: hypothetical protein VGW40_00110 [Allosphingosinicella sp.]|nr:hypothetical protein [Allosphingosinicella sp.]
MRKLFLISVAAAILVPALPAQAEPAAQAGPRSEPQSRGRDEAADPNRQICVSERLSGSRMPRRVCRTAREWQLLQADDSDDR